MRLIELGTRLSVPDRLQKFLGIGFERGARLVEHRPVPLVTIWMRRPSAVMSINNWFLNCLRLALASMIASSCPFRSIGRERSWRSRAFFIIELRGAALPRSCCSAPRIEIDALVAFDVATLDLAHRSGEIFTAALDDARAVATARTALHRHLERILEKLGNTLQIALGCRPSNHISRKKAIIAVTKSA